MCLPKALPDIVLYYHLYDELYCLKKAKKTKADPYILQGTYKTNLKIPHILMLSRST